jgi:hypothetical protein
MTAQSTVLDFDAFATAPQGAPAFGALPGSDQDPFSFLGSQEDVEGVEVLDLTTVDENARAKRLVLAPGTYNAIIDSAEYKKSKTSGKPMIQVVFKAFHPADAGKSVKVYHYLILTEQFLPRVKGFMLTLAPDVDLASFNPLRVAGQLIGRQARLKLKVGSFNDEAKNEVDGDKGILPPQNDPTWG